MTFLSNPSCELCTVAINIRHQHAQGFAQGKTTNHFNRRPDVTHDSGYFSKHTFRSTLVNKFLVVTYVVRLSSYRPKCTALNHFKPTWFISS